MVSVLFVTFKMCAAQYTTQELYLDTFDDARCHCFRAEIVISEFNQII